MAVSAGPDIVENGLVLCLDAGNRRSYPGTGTGWFDISGVNTNGTLTNGPTYSFADSGIITFDGSDDVVILSPNTLFQFTNTQPFTISVWCKWTQTSGFSTLFAFAQTSGPGYYLTLDKSLLRENAFFFDYFDGSSFRGIQGNINSITQNAWINLTATSASNSVSDMKVYQNGILTSYTNRGVGTPATPDYSGSNLQIGARGSGGYLQGNISSCMVYNRALNEQEILQNFNALRGRFNI